MSWTDWLPATLQPFSKYYWAKQPYKSAQERAWAAGAIAWPPPTFIWQNGGSVGSVVNNNNGTYTINISGITLTSGRWYNYPTTDYTPRFYDLIIDNPFDETTCLHLRIVGNNTTSFTVTDTPIADALTSKFLSSTGSLVGRAFYVIRRGGLWWSDRWIDFPNDRESWNGTAMANGVVLPLASLTSVSTTATATTATDHHFVTGDSVTIAGASPGGYNGSVTIAATGARTFTYTIGSTLASPATGTITATNTAVGAHDTAASYTPGAFVGFDLMVAGSDGYLHRLSITDNDATNLFFARQTFTVSGQYGVITAGGKWRMINSNCRPHAGYIPRWYDSSNPGEAPVNPFDTYFSRSPVDLSIFGAKLPKSTIQLLGGGTCSTPVTEQIFDVDFLTAYNETCNPPDSNYTPEIYKGLRGLQVAIEDLATFYVKNVSYEGASSIPNFTAATFFQAAGIGLSWTTTTGSLSGSNINYSTSGISLPYTPINVYYAVINSDGTPSTFGQGSIQTSGVLSKNSGSFASGDTGKTLVIATGWTRIFERSFMYLYAKKCWIPSIVSGVAVDPPTSAHAGSWTFRGKSSKYREVSDIGIINDSLGIDTFNTGDFARYEGDNNNDPNIHPETLTTDTTGLDGYYANLIESTLPPTQQAALQATMSGTVTAYTNFSITDTTKNWWPGGVLHTETGTFDSGGTTHGGDSTKSGSGYWGNGTFGSNNWLDQLTIQITISGVEYRRFFNSSGTLDLSWGDALPSSANGQSYVIRAPKYEMNRWQGRNVLLTFADGSTQTVTAYGNDDCTLFFPTQSFTQAVVSYQILEEYPGGVWKWDGTQWIKPTGNDARTGAPWHDNQRENHPLTKKRYGRACKFDITFKTFWQEIYNGLQTLTALKWPMAWNNQGNTNVAGAANSAYAAGELTLGQAQSDAAALWAGSQNTSVSGAPYCAAYTDYNCACYTYGISRRYSYGVVTGLVGYQSCAVDFYVKCNIPLDLDAITSTTVPLGSCSPIATFDDNGDGVRLNVWHQYDSQSATTGATSGQLGSLNIPNTIGPAPAVCPTPGFCAEFSGYTVVDQTAILRFNVSGGFVYQ